MDADIDPVESICQALRAMTKKTEETLRVIQKRRDRMKALREENTALRDELDGNVFQMYDKLALAEDAIENGLKREQFLGEALRFIADQGCQTPIVYTPPGPDDGITECTETEKCVTEYCLPCYAKAHLKEHAQMISCAHPKKVLCAHCGREICPDCGKGYCEGGC
jgi:hypothetical protein